MSSAVSGLGEASVARKKAPRAASSRRRKGLAENEKGGFRWPERRRSAPDVGKVKFYDKHWALHQGTSLVVASFEAGGRWHPGFLSHFKRFVKSAYPGGALCVQL